MPGADLRDTCGSDAAHYGPPPCASPRCARPGLHVDACPGEHCAGCQPRPAAGGSRLCPVCTHRMRADAYAAARLHDELAEVLLPARHPGGGSGGPAASGGLDIDDRAVAARAHIRAVLTSWCRLIAEEQAVDQPRDDVRAAAAYIDRHARWLAAHDAAGDAADELAQLAHGPARSVAYPSPTRRVTIAACPHPGCPGRLYAVTHHHDDLLPAQISCSADVAHQWPAPQWNALRRRLAAAA